LDSLDRAILTARRSRRYNQLSSQTFHIEILCSLALSCARKWPALNDGLTRRKGFSKVALKTYKPTTPGLRQLVTVDRSDLYEGKPLKALTVGKPEKGGRNNAGRITVRFRGGGHKQSYRIVEL
jgi:hypothetical protein